MPITFDEIKQRFHDEQANPIVPRTRDDMPPTYESITDEWLTDVLGKDTPGAEVISHQLGPEDNGTSNRRRIAVEWNQAGRDAGLVEKLFCKGTQSLESRYMLGSEPVLTLEGEAIIDAKGRRSYVTSAGSGPSLGKHLLLTYLPPEHAVEGNQLKVEYLGGQYTVTVARVGSQPLFDPNDERMKG